MTPTPMLNALNLEFSFPIKYYQMTQKKIHLNLLFLPKAEFSNQLKLSNCSANTS